MTTPTEGVNATGVDLNDATDLFLDRWKDADTPSDTDEGETSRKDDATVLEVEENDDDELDLHAEDEDGDDSEAEDNEEDDDAGVAPIAGDDHRVTLTVDGEEKSVTVKELKRLYGQEASLTRKSQEVAQARKQAEQDGERFMVATQKLLTKAEERYAPFAKIDWMVAQQRLTPDEFAALRQEAQEAHSDLQFLKAEADDVLSQISVTKQEERRQVAAESIKTLEKNIPGWNREVYSQVCQYAVDKGANPEDVSSIVDANALTFIYKAMRYDALKAKAAAKKTTPKAAPKRIVKPTSSRSSNLATGTRPKEGLAKLAKTGSRDDAVSAFMERWADQND